MRPAQSLFDRARSSTAVVLVTTTAVGAVAGAAAASTTATAAVASITGGTEDSAAEDTDTAATSEHTDEHLAPTNRSVTARQSAYPLALRSPFASAFALHLLASQTFSFASATRLSLSHAHREQAFVCRYPLTACSFSTLNPLPRASLIFVA